MAGNVGISGGDFNPEEEGVYGNAVNPSGGEAHADAEDVDPGRKAIGERHGAVQFRMIGVAPMIRHFAGRVGRRDDRILMNGGGGIKLGEALVGGEIDGAKAREYECRRESKVLSALPFGRR